MSCDLFRLHGSGGDCAIVAPLKARVAELEKERETVFLGPLREETARLLLDSREKRVAELEAQHEADVKMKEEAYRAVDDAVRKLSAANAEIVRLKEGYRSKFAFLRHLLGKAEHCEREGGYKYERLQHDHYQAMAAALDAGAKP